MPDSQKLTFDGSFESLNLLFKLHPQGVAFHCPICDSRLTVATTWEDARNQSVHPGVYCPVDSSHVYRMFNIKRDLK
jgi:hypothetical protein